MTVVFKVKENLKSSFQSGHQLLCCLENLKSLTLTFNTEPKAVNSHAGPNMFKELAHLNQLEELKLSIKYY